MSVFLIVAAVNFGRASALAPTDALQLLHCHFADDAVRGIAVRILDAIADPQLESFLLQLVQVYCCEFVCIFPSTQFGFLIALFYWK